MDEEILFRENIDVALSLINEDLYRVVNKSLVLFHDNNCFKLFFIYFHDYSSSEFSHPSNSKRKTSLLDLTLEFCGKYKKDKCFNKILKDGNILLKFLSKKRKYPNISFKQSINSVGSRSVDFEMSISEMITFFCNYSKHSYFRLSKLKKKMGKYLNLKDLNLVSEEDYYNQLEYFIRYFIVGKLNYHQTKVVELAGNYFLSINNMMNSEHHNKFMDIIKGHMMKALMENDSKGAVDLNKPKLPLKPNNLSEIEELFWKIMWVERIKDPKFVNLIPSTDPYLQLRD